ncbi:uncharacterized protein [Coffea arabica]|uniref:Uncharacterized protein n=1 Tax=Coffea arabica TaxID=13443 RepID=A0ABM4VYU1_COFAR
MIAGDFNDICSNEKKLRGRIKEEWTFNDFRNFINENQPIDIGCEGQPWTWSNNWEGDGEIKQRLDRTLNSAQWNQNFENAKCTHVKTHASDHSALLVDNTPLERNRRKRFFFDKRWLQRDGISNVIKEAWNKSAEGSRMFQVKTKVRNYRIALLKWSNRINKNSRKRIKNIKEQLDQIKGASLENKRKEKAILKVQLREVYRDEEMFWSQKARLKWLQEGNKNTHFFHAQVNGRRKNNRMQKLPKEDGSWTETKAELGAEIGNYYRMCKEINSMLSNFWWGKKDNENKIHWVAWKQLTNEKKREGMGIQEIQSFKSPSTMGWDSRVDLELQHLVGIIN